MTLRSLATTCLFPMLAATLAAQSFQYADFSNTTTLSLLGSTVANANTLRLTNTIQQTGWAWHRTQFL